MWKSDRDHIGPSLTRIQKKQVGAGERAAIAAEIACGGRLGVLDGVEVDFRHPELPPEDWEARPFWHVWGSPPSNAGILFPGEASHAPEAQLREFKGGLSIPLIAVAAGDRISIESVITEIADRRFDHPHDAQKRLALLRIEKASGEVVHPPGPLMFYGTTQIRRGATRESFDHILGRICRHAGTETLYERGLNGYYKGTDFDWDMPLEQIARHFAADAHDAFFDLQSRFPEGDLGGAHLRNLANSAALAGFLLGKIEARKSEQVAGSVMANRDRATEKVTRVDWLAKAKAIWAEHPDWRRTRVAHMIAEGSDDDPRAIMRAIKKIDPHL